YLGDVLDRTAEVEAVAGWHRQGSDADSVQARVHVAHLGELLGRHRIAWGAEGVRDSTATASRWYGGAFAQDTWSPVHDIFVEAGVCLERDGLAASTDVLLRAVIARVFSGLSVSLASALV